MLFKVLLRRRTYVRKILASLSFLTFREKEGIGTYGEAFLNVDENQV